ncbi:MAG TPA: exodeoxyribonuclease V subunit gamma [Polyangiaceae bacterium]|nr:exodeoxyribonuclease V subunit gamma [Polyangiaceae bacterium]
MTFHVHRTNRVERLVTALAAELETPRGGAFHPEAVVVPGHGMKVWLSMELSRRLGVWATPIVYPRGLVDDVARRVLGQQVLGVEPLSEELLEWGIRAALPGMLADRDFVELARYVKDDPHGVRLGELCARLATVFDQYLTYRPEWVRAWEGGGTVSVGPEDRFQALLLRKVSERLRARHVGELELTLLARLGEGRPLGLPERISVLGVSTLPPLFVRILVALAAQSEVHLYLFAPSPVLEPEVRPDAKRPLLAGLGKVGVELDSILAATLAEQRVEAVRHDHFEHPAAASGVGAPPTLLTALQASLFDPDAPPLSAQPLASRDESIVVHACHGPTREVEVLHDQLLSLLTRAEDPVPPEDVLVLVSELETYAPLIEAVFRRDPGDARYIPFHVSDRGSRRESALTDAFLRVLGMVRGRVTAAEVLDLLMLEPVRRRIGIDASGADTIKEWVAAAGVRWGRDAAHREAMGLPAAGGANTWRFGIQRLLLGYAFPSDERRTFGGLAGYDEVEGNDAVLLGALAGFVRTLFGWLTDLERPRPLAEWSLAVTSLLAALFPDDPETERQIAGIRRAVESMSEAAASAGFEGELDIAVLRELIERRVDGLSPERGFLAGGVTFSAMVPMRSIPFRVIAVLGMNDDAFPRSPRPVEFDLVRNGRTPRSEGDRSPRDDDRYLFLETLCAAREKLIVLYTGRSVRDDRELAPSVCLAELLDTLAGPVGSETSRARRRQLIVEHHLQSFSPAYFDGKDPRLFSYAKEYEGGARGLVALEAKPRGFIERLEPLERGKELGLEDLLRFWKSPPAYLLNRRLGIYLKKERVELGAREPLDIDALDRWKIGNPLIAHCLDGIAPAESERLLRGRGELPLGDWGRRVLEDYRTKADAIARTTQARRGGDQREALELAIPLGSGIRLTGTLDGRFPRGRVEHTFSQSSPRYVLSLWIRHLAQCAAGTAEPSALVTQVKDKPPLVETFRPLEAAEARAYLEPLVEGFLEGQLRPLRFLPLTSHAYACALAKVSARTGPKTPIEALASARLEYDGKDLAESTRDAHAPLAFDRRRPPFDERYDTEESALETTEFHRLACTVFGPILARVEEDC